MKINKFDVFKTIADYSDDLKYHLENNISIVDNIFRPGSESYLALLGEVRELYDTGSINLEGIDKELFDETDIGRFEEINGKVVPLDLPVEELELESVNEAEYKGKQVKLNYPMRNTGAGKKYYVYVKSGDKVKKVSFGDVKGGLTAKVSNPEARKAFASRHNCKDKKDKTKPGYWACRANRYGHLWGGNTYSGYW